MATNVFLVDYSGSGSDLKSNLFSFCLLDTPHLLYANVNILNWGCKVNTRLVWKVANTKSIIWVVFQTDFVFAAIILVKFCFKNYRKRRWKRISACYKKDFFGKSCYQKSNLITRWKNAIFDTANIFFPFA